MGCNLSCIYQSILSVLPPTSNPAPDALHTRVELKTHIPLLIHLSCVVPAFFVAFPLMRVKKGTKAHRVLGTLFMVLMTVGVGITYWIKLLRRKDETRGTLKNMLSYTLRTNTNTSFRPGLPFVTVVLSKCLLPVLDVSCRHDHYAVSYLPFDTGAETKGYQGAQAVDFLGRCFSRCWRTSPTTRTIDRNVAPRRKSGMAASRCCRDCKGAGFDVCGYGDWGLSPVTLCL